MSAPAPAAPVPAPLPSSTLPPTPALTPAAATGEGPAHRPAGINTRGEDVVASILAKLKANVGVHVNALSKLYF